MANSTEIFENLIPCDRYLFPFVDRYAQFGTTFESGRGMGPCMMALRSTNMTCQPSDCLLNLWLDDDGDLVPVVRQELSHLPWRVSESGQIATQQGNIDVDAVHQYLNSRVLATRFRFTNTSEQAITVRLIYSGLATGDRFSNNPKERRTFGLPTDYPSRVNWVNCEDQIIEGGMKDENFQLPSPSFHIRSSSNFASHCSSEPLWVQTAQQKSVSTAEARGLHYQFDGEISLAPGESLDHTFTIECTVATYACHEPSQHAIVPNSIDFESELERAKRDFEQRVDFAHPPEAKASQMTKAWRARWALLRCGFEADNNGGEWGTDIGSTCTANNSGFTRNFFWDGLFTSAALVDWNPAYARGAMKTVFSRMDERGYNPEHTYNYHTPGRSILGQTQAPVATWAMDKYLQANPDDDAFLASYYPTMLKNHQHWLKCADRDGDGLMEWQWGGQTADDSPLYDLFTGGQTNWFGPQASVSLNAFLHLDAHNLAKFADRLGKKDDAIWLREEAAKREALFMEICYVPEEKRFWDYCHMTQRHVRAKTFYMVWPIWAGMNVPAEAKKELIENVLLDPEQFFGAIPFPSTAYSEPEYDENQYWRGKAWPHISYWLIEMLEKEGYHEAAKDARKRLLSAWLRDPAFPENMRTDPHKYEAHHQPDYNWGIAFAYLLLTDS